MQSEEWIGDEIFTESAITSYAPRTTKAKESLWEHLSYVIDLYRDQDQIKLQSKLLNVVDREYKSANINNMLFENIKFFEKNNSEYCTFSDCIFRNCSFNSGNINYFTFIGCSFFNCSTTTPLSNCLFINCLEENGNVTDTTLPDSETECSESIMVQRFILEKFWPTGKESITFAHRPLALFFGNSQYPTNIVKIAIDTLTRQGIIIDAKKKSWIGIDTAKVMEIASVLGK